MTAGLPASAVNLLVSMPGWLGETVVASAVRCRPDRPRL